jgi:hypothetical protein
MPSPDLGELPAGTTTPALDDRDRLVLFAPEAPPMIERPDPIITTRPATEWPGIVILDGHGQTILPRRSIEGPVGVRVRSLAPALLARDRNAWVAYDAPTGELLRLRLVEREQR